MAQKKNPAGFIEIHPLDLDPAIASLIEVPLLPDGLCRLFVNQALELVAAYFAGVGKAPVIAKAEVAFPGPYMRVVTRRRSFYFAWDKDDALAVETSREQYPRAARVSRSVTVVPTGSAHAGVEDVRKMLRSRLSGPASD